MFLVPFLFRTPLPSGIDWIFIPISLFLENRGKQFCSVEDADSWLEENGFVAKQMWTVGEKQFVEIDPEKTNLREFYSFEQVTKEQSKGTEECWRTFFYMKSKSADIPSEDAWNETFEEQIQYILHEIYKTCKK